MRRKTIPRVNPDDTTQADKYHFCEGCEYKSKIYKDGKLIRYTCPARFDPYDSAFEADGTARKDGKGCPKGQVFAKMEKDKNEYNARNRP